MKKNIAFSICVVVCACSIAAVLMKGERLKAVEKTHACFCYFLTGLSFSDKALKAQPPFRGLYVRTRTDSIGKVIDQTVITEDELSGAN